MTHAHATWNCAVCSAHQDLGRSHTFSIEPSMEIPFDPTSGRLDAIEKVLEEILRVIAPLGEYSPILRLARCSGMDAVRTMMNDRSLR